MTDEELIALVRQDLTTGLSEWFDIADVVADDPADEPLGAARTVIATDDQGNQTLAIGWRIHSTHRAPIHGIPVRPGTQIMIRGATIVRVDQSGEPPRFHRYVEWHDVYAQLGTTHGGRRVVSPDDDPNIQPG